MRIEHAAAGQRGALGPVADHQPVAGPHAGRLFQPQLGQLTFAASQSLAFHQHQPRRPMAAAVMHPHARVVAQWRAVGRQTRGAFEQDVDRLGGLSESGQGNGGAARELVAR